MNVPNPFRLIDGLLIDYVFNPLSWRCEYHFGKDAIDLWFISFAVGLMLAIPTEWLAGRYYVSFGMVGLSVYVWSARGNIIRNWRSANKTGKNVNRVNFFAMRMWHLIVVAGLVMIASSDAVLSLREVINVTGWFMLFVVCSYFFAADRMPPLYHERRLRPQLG